MTSIWDSVKEEIPYLSIGETPPSSPVQGTVWVDTSTSPSEWKQWNGSGWVPALPFEEYATAAQGALADTAVQNVQGVSGIWQGTQEEYDALTPDTNTLYFIV